MSWTRLAAGLNGRTTHAKGPKDWATRLSIGFGLLPVLCLVPVPCYSSSHPSYSSIFPSLIPHLLYPQITQTLVLSLSCWEGKQQITIKVGVVSFMRLQKEYCTMQRSCMNWVAGDAVLILMALINNLRIEVSNKKINPRIDI